MKGLVRAQQLDWGWLGKKGNRIGLVHRKWEILGWVLTKGLPDNSFSLGQPLPFLTYLTEIYRLSRRKRSFDGCYFLGYLDGLGSFAWFHVRSHLWWALNLDRSSGPCLLAWAWAMLDTSRSISSWVAHTAPSAEEERVALISEPADEVVESGEERLLEVRLVLEGCSRGGDKEGHSWSCSNGSSSPSSPKFTVGLSSRRRVRR